MTFLQYCCERLLGPPTRPGSSEGESYWHCPFHADDNPSFHTLPHTSRYRDFWKCFSCGLHGDEYQLLRNLRDMVGDPTAAGTYGDHQALLHLWREEFAQLNASTEGKSTHSGQQSSNGRAVHGPNLSSSVGALSNAVLKVHGELSAEEQDVLIAAYAIAQKHNVPLSDLAWYEFDFRRSFEEMERAHQRTCFDPECTARLCIAARAKAERRRRFQEAVEALKRNRANKNGKV
jgi:hypothetical protein